MFNDDDLLPLSGLQHLAFCRRQWALIHVERLWAESDRTVEGKHLHERSDDPFADQTRGDVILARAVPLVSRQLGLIGLADAVEFRRAADPPPGTACPLPGREGLYAPRPVEYKRGEPKSDDRDEVQVAAQAICLEEMLHVSIPAGDLFYGRTRHRTEVVFTDPLRQRVVSLARQMHELFQTGATPPAVLLPHCRLCSLADLCVPKLVSPKITSVQAYLDRALRQPLSED
jgi:CRISPR-associated exonuclease Cas4